MSDKVLQNVCFFTCVIHNTDCVMVILDGNSEIVLQIRSNLFYLKCSRHLIRSKSCHKSDDLYPKRPLFLHKRALYIEVPSNISTMDCVDSGNDNFPWDLSTLSNVPVYSAIIYHIIYQCHTMPENMASSGFT